MPTLTTFEAKIQDVSQHGDHASIGFRRWQGGHGEPVQHHRFPIDEPFGAAMLALALEHPWVRVTIDEAPQPARVVEVVRLSAKEVGEHHVTIVPGEPNGVRLVRDAALTYAEVGHTHAGYAPTTHQHQGYAAEAHTHAGYAPTTHQHAGYAAEAHTHAGYAAAGHTHAEHAPLEHIVVSQHALTIAGGRPVTGHVRLADLPGADPNLPTTSEQARARRLRLVYAELQPQTTETAPCFTSSAITTTPEMVANERVWIAGVSVTLMRHAPGAMPTQVMAAGNVPQVYTLSLCLAYT